MGLLGSVFEFYSRYTVTCTFLQMVVTIILSLASNSDWKSCSRDPQALNDMYSCTSNYPGASECCVYDNASLRVCCYSVVESFLGSPCYFVPAYGGKIIAVGDPIAGTCSAGADNQTVCNNWFALKFTVMGLTALQFLVHFFYYHFFDDFDPQTVCYVLLSQWKLWRIPTMLRPRNSILGFLECATIIVAWMLFMDGQLKSFVSCYNGTWTSSDKALPVLFALFITLQHVFKPNIVLMLKHKCRCVQDDGGGCSSLCDKCGGMLYFLRLDVTIMSFLVMALQALVFAFSLILLGCPFMYCDSKYHLLEDDKTGCCGEAGGCASNLADDHHSRTSSSVTPAAVEMKSIVTTTGEKIEIV